MLDTPESLAIVCGVAGIVFGFLVALIWFAQKKKRLEHQNIELHSQVKYQQQALERAGAELDLRFKATAQEALSKTSEQFLQLAQEKLQSANKDSAHDLEKRQKAIEGIVDPVNKALQQMDEKLKQMEKNSVSSHSELQTHLRTMTEDQVRLRRETGTLVQALRSPSTRGQWGEMQLRRCLEMAGMQLGVHFDEQVLANSGQRPDVIVKMTGGKTIVIDSKVALDAYLDALRDGISEEERTAYLQKHASQVRTHIRGLAAKTYFDKFNSPEFVVMFLPGESYFSAALERDPSLIEAAVNEKVIMATPTTLISLLKAVMYGWRQEALAQNAKDISTLGAELYERISVFASHMGKVGRGLDGAMDAYNKAISSLESRVLVTARKFEELQAVGHGKDIELLEPVDHAVRQLNAPEALQNQDVPEKRRA